MDKFDEWNEVKKATNVKPYENIKISEKNIYWVKIGQNVGSEIYGKGEYYTRPVLVLKKFYIKNYINCFLGVPLSSKTKGKSGSLFYKFTTNNNKMQVALLSQIRVFDAKRVSDYYKGKILKDDFIKIKEKIKSSF